MKKYQVTVRELMVVERAAWSNPRVRRILKAAPLVVLFLLLNNRSARAACSFTPSPDPTVDGSAESLRHAIQTANASGTDCFIQLQAGIYTLTIPNTSGQDNTAAEGDLDITDGGHTVTIQGKSAATSIVNGNGIDRVFQVLGGANAVFSNLTIEGGLAQDDGTAGALPGTTVAEGGGVLVQDGGHVRFTHVIVQANKADGGNGHGGTPAHATGSLGQRAEGGGLFLSSGAINLSGSTVSENTATGGMGGQGRFAKCSFNSQLHCDGPSGPGGDGGASAGGGLYVLSGTARLFTSTVSGNAANGNSGGGGGGFTAGPTFHFCCQNGGNGGAAQGGGLFLVDGNLTLTQATVSGNSVTAGGGGFGGTGFPPFLGASGGAARGAGIFVSNGNVSAINSTVFGNAANGGKSGSTRFNNHGPAGDAEGGGLYLNHGAVALTGITLASNLTLTPSSLSGMFGVSRGGGIANSGAGLYINSALIGNDNTFIGCVSGCQGKANDGNDVSGPITSSHSLIGETSGATITDEGGNHFNVDPGLDPTGIQFNGGPTETIALLSGSPAINQGDNAICKAPAPTGLAGIDQRGFSRFSDGDGLCDIGAYELNAKLEPTFAGQPGAPNCHGKSVSALTHQHGNLSSAASALGFSSVKALQAAIRAFCGG